MDKPYGWCADKICLSPKVRDPWETDFAALVPRFTGGLSAISSTLIIYVILRSQTRLSSIYHRIMFGMSLADICGSTAMALTSLPMPSYMPEELAIGYSWAGTRLGNEYTCNAQGFFQTFGMISMYAYNGMLCVYYACAIAFAMRELKIKKYVEPILHGFPLVLGLGLAIPPLFFELYNPDITAFPSCQIIPYPGSCMTHVVDCIRGDPEVMAKMLPVLYLIIPLDLIIIFISMVLVIRAVIRTDRLLKTVTAVFVDSENINIQQEVERQRRTKASLLQAVSYVLAFALTLLFPLMRLTLYFTNFTSTQDEENKSFALFDKLTLVFLPLQGFFNFVIFLCFKVYNHRRVNREKSTCQILKIIFVTSVQDPIIISGISMVKQNESVSDVLDDALHNVDANDNIEQHKSHPLTDFEGHESNYGLKFRLSYLLQVAQSDNQNVDALGDRDDAPIDSNVEVNTNPSKKQTSDKSYLFSLSSADGSAMVSDGKATIKDIEANITYRKHKTNDLNSLFSYSSGDAVSASSGRGFSNTDEGLSLEEGSSPSCRDKTYNSKNSSWGEAISTVTEGFNDEEPIRGSLNEDRNNNGLHKSIFSIFSRRSLGMLDVSPSSHDTGRHSTDGACNNFSERVDSENDIGQGDTSFSN